MLSCVFDNRRAYSQNTHLHNQHKHPLFESDLISDAGGWPSGSLRCHANCKYYFIKCTYNIYTRIREGELNYKKIIFLKKKSNLP